MAKYNWRHNKIDKAIKGAIAKTIIATAYHKIEGI
jgi:hypothetical protein